jgi:hypothetical protein
MLKGNNKILITLILFGVATFCSQSLFAQDSNGWAVFSRVEFKPKFVEDFNAHMFYPEFTKEILAMESKEITLEGYVIPLPVDNEVDFTVLSYYPYAQCFFCGGAGPETIATVYFKGKTKKFKVDEFIKVKGILVLNAEDIDKTNFIITDAVLVNNSK